jgi:hypothetical protein
MKYTPDWFVFLMSKHSVVVTPPAISVPGTTFKVQRKGEPPLLKLIEIKGAHIWDRDIVRFKGARAYWPEFQFEMHQKKNGIWTRIM